MNPVELVSIPGASNANTYATIQEFDEYISGRDGFNEEEWKALTLNQQLLRIVYGTAVIDSLVFRGKKATRKQALAFPRIFQSDELSDVQGKMETWEDLSDYCDLMGLPLPEVPEKVKIAQIEATYQIVHSHLFTIEPFEDGEASISSLSIDVISLSFSKAGGSAYSLFSKADFSAASTIKLMLQPYLTTFRGSLV